MFLIARVFVIESSRVMDVVDKAAWLTEAERAEGARRAQAAIAAAGLADCADCGDAIEAERRAALPSARRCVACQGGFERQARGHRPAPIIGGDE